jgi:hypothetical protein
VRSCEVALCSGPRSCVPQHSGDRVRGLVTGAGARRSPSCRVAPCRWEGDGMTLWRSIGDSGWFREAPPFRGRWRRTADRSRAHGAPLCPVLVQALCSGAGARLYEAVRDAAPVAPVSRPAAGWSGRPPPARRRAHGARWTPVSPASRAAVAALSTRPRRFARMVDPIPTPGPNVESGGWREGAEVMDFCGQPKT